MSCLFCFVVFVFLVALGIGLRFALRLGPFRLHHVVFQLSRNLGWNLTVSNLIWRQNLRSLEVSQLPGFSLPFQLFALLCCILLPFSQQTVITFWSWSDSFVAILVQTWGAFARLPPRPLFMPQRFQLGQRAEMPQERASFALISTSAQVLVTLGKIP